MPNLAAAAANAGQTFQSQDTGTGVYRFDVRFELDAVTERDLDRRQNTAGQHTLHFHLQPHDDLALQGPVEAFTSPPSDSVAILGVVVDTTGIADNNFEGLDDMPIGRATFFATLQTTDLVKAQGNLAGNTVIWDEIELED